MNKKPGKNPASFKTQPKDRPELSFTDTNYIDLMLAHAALGPEDCCVEVGPGQGGTHEETSGGDGSEKSIRPGSRRTFEALSGTPGGTKIPDSPSSGRMRCVSTIRSLIQPPPR